MVGRGILLRLGGAIRERLLPLHVDTKPAWLRLVVFLSPALLVGLLFFAHLGRRDLISSHEARAAQNAQRMLDTGEWGLPVLFDNRLDLQKPPGYYWSVAAIGWLNGGTVTEWVARLPAALAGLVCVLLTSFFLRRESRPTAAIVAALVLATASHFTSITRTARIDVPLACAVTLSLLAFYRGCRVGSEEPNPPTPFPTREGGAEPVPQGRLESPSPCRGGAASEASGVGLRLAWHLLAAVSAAMAVLLKGPVGLALIGPAAVAWLVVERFFRPRSERPRVPLASWVLIPLVVAGIALPWFLWANQATGGEFFRVFFWHHTIARFTGSSPQLASHPAWYYLPRFAIDFLPWTPVLLGPLAWSIRSGHWQRDPVFRFALVTFVVMFLVLSTARFKRADYLLPAYPFAALVVGCAGEAWLASRSDPRTLRTAKWVFGGAIAAAVVGWLVMALVVEPAEQAKEQRRQFAAVIREHAPAPQTILQFRMESHLLSYHLGRPVHTFVEWGELNELLSRPGPHFVVMPPEYVHPAGEIVTSRKLIPITRLTDFVTGKPLRPLVFLRTAD